MDVTGVNVNDTCAAVFTNIFSFAVATELASAAIAEDTGIASKNFNADIIRSLVFIIITLITKN